MQMISSNPSTAQKVAPVAPSPAPASSNKGKAKETVTTMETLNSPGVQAAQLDDDFGVSKRRLLTVCVLES